MRVLYGWGSAGIQKGLAAALLALFASMIATSVAAQRPEINERPSAASTVTITKSPLPEGVVGSSYSAQLSATGGTGPYTFTQTVGTLPPGITFNSSGTFGGVPTGPAGPSQLTFTATDSSGKTSKAVSLALFVAPAVTVNTTSLGIWRFGVYHSVTLGASGGTGGPYTFTASGLPNGLSVNGNAISGKPGAAGAFPVTITATDKGGHPGSSAYTLTVQAPIILVTTTSLTSGNLGQLYPGATITASGGSGSYTFAQTGLPNGLALDPNSGAISGTPTQAGSFTVAFTATDTTSSQYGGPFTGTRSLTLKVAAPTIKVTTASLPGGTFGQLYPGATITASGGSGSYTFTQTGLPNGLALDPNSGVISGTPTQAGSFTVTFTATDITLSQYGAPITGTRSLTLKVAAPTIKVTTLSLAAGTVGRSYSSSLSASGGNPPYTFNSTNALPSGLSITGTAITGTPTTAGNYYVYITATDSTSSANGGPFTSEAKQLALNIAKQKCMSPPCP